MTLLIYILIFSFIGSVVSIIGGTLLLLKEKFARKISHFLASFAAGTLLGTAFFDLLPEAMEFSQETTDIFLWALVGILVFFLIERFIHHHGDYAEEGSQVVPLIVIGDTLHNFIDGVAMAASFLISIPLGIVTSLAVAAHEIPQEMGDFGLMLHKGISRARILLINLISAASALAGAVLTYMAKDSIEKLLPIILALTAGFFIYIAASNLIPEIHHTGNKKMAFWETILLFAGVLTVWVVISLLEGKV